MRSERELFDAIYSKLGVALNGMDIVQSLNDLEKRLLDLRQRTAAKIEPQVAPVSKPDSSEVKALAYNLYMRNLYIRNLYVPNIFPYSEYVMLLKFKSFKQTHLGVLLII